MTYIVQKAFIQGKKVHEVDVVFNYITKRLFVYNKATSRQVESFFTTFPIKVEKVEENTFKLKLSNLNICFDNVQAPQQYIQHTISYSKLEQIVWNVLQQTIAANKGSPQYNTPMLFIYHINSGSLCFTGLAGFMTGSGHFERFFHDQFMYVLIQPSNNQEQQIIELFIPAKQISNHNVRRFLLMIKFALIETGKQVVSQSFNDIVNNNSSENQQIENTGQLEKQQVTVYERTFKEGQNQSFQVFSNFVQQNIPQNETQELDNALKSLQGHREECLNLCLSFQQISDYFAKQNIYQLLRMPWQLFLQFGYKIDIFKADFDGNQNFKTLFNMKQYSRSDQSVSNSKKIIIQLTNDNQTDQQAEIAELIYLGIKDGLIKRFHTTGSIFLGYIQTYKDWNQFIQLDFLCIADDNDKELLIIECGELKDSSATKQTQNASNKILLHIQGFFRRSRRVKFKDFSDRRCKNILMHSVNVQKFEEVRTNFIRLWNDNSQNNDQNTEIQEFKSQLKGANNDISVDCAFATFMFRESDKSNTEFVLINQENSGDKQELQQIQEMKYTDLDDQSILFIHLKNYNYDGNILDLWYSWRGKHINEAAQEFLRKQQAVFSISQNKSFIQSIETTQFLTLMSDFDTIHPKKGLLAVQNVSQTDTIHHIDVDNLTLKQNIQILDYRNEELEINISEDSLEKSQQFEIISNGRLAKATTFKNGFAYLKFGSNYMLIINQGTNQEMGIQLKLPLGPTSIDITNIFKIVPWQLIAQRLKCVILSIHENLDKFQFYNDSFKVQKDEQRVFYVIKDSGKQTIYLKEQFMLQNRHIQHAHVIIKPDGSIQLLYIQEADVEIIKDAVLTFFEQKSQKQPKIEILRDIQEADQSNEIKNQSEQKINNAIFYIDKKQVWLVTQEDVCKQINRLFNYEFPYNSQNASQDSKNDATQILCAFPIILLEGKFIISICNREQLVAEPILVNFMLKNNIKLLDMQFICVFNIDISEKKKISHFLYQQFSGSYFGLSRQKQLVIEREDLGFLYESCKYYYRRQIEQLYNEILRNEDPEVGTTEQRYQNYVQLRRSFLDEFIHGNFRHNLYQQWLENYRRKKHVDDNV